jgi:hypothetical protein
MIIENESTVFREFKNHNLKLRQFRIMSGSAWKESLCSCCLYVYGDESRTIQAEDFKNVEGVSTAISVSDFANPRGGEKFLVLFENSTGTI